MYKKYQINPLSLYIGLGLMAFAFIGSSVFGSSTSPSSWEMFQYGMVKIFYGVAGLIGSIITIGHTIYANQKYLRYKNKCLKCLSAVDRKTENFCRNCGTEL